MAEQAEAIIDWTAFAAARALLGAEFLRILGYFREDGVKSVAAIEAAMRDHSAVAMIIPAHTLKGESLQFGAEELGELAELIETTARDCVEWKQEPDGLLPDVARLRGLFDATIAAFDRETNPLVERRGGTGRGPVVTNQRFGAL